MSEENFMLAAEWVNDGRKMRPARVIERKGRCIHIRFGEAPSWTDLAFDLLGAGNPCEEFRLDGKDLYARLKTAEQIAADDAAIDYDEAN